MSSPSISTMSTPLKQVPNATISCYHHTFLSGPGDWQLTASLLQSDLLHFTIVPLLSTPHKTD